MTGVIIDHSRSGGRSFIGASTNVLAVGTRVMQSRYRVDRLKLDWLNCRSCYAHVREGYREYWVRAKNERGTVLAILDGPYCLGYRVQWDDRAAMPPSECMADFIEPADD